MKPFTNELAEEILNEATEMLRTHFNKRGLQVNCEGGAYTDGSLTMNFELLNGIMFDFGWDIPEDAYASVSEDPMKLPQSV